MPPIQFLVEHRERGQTVAEMLHKRFKLSWSAAKRIVERLHRQCGPGNFDYVIMTDGDLDG